MGASIQIRNVPEHVSRRLKAMAAAQGQSLSEFLLGEVTVLANRPTLKELTERISHRSPLDIDAADVVREARDARDAQLLAANLGADFLDPGLDQRGD